MRELRALKYKDFTVKAIISDLNLIAEKLSRLKADFIGVDHQTDHYFKTTRGKLKLRQGTIENLITHYERISENGIEKTIVYRYDVNPTESQIAALLQNHEKIGVVVKDRCIYQMENIKIHLDRDAGGMQFIEIEVMDRENLLTDVVLKAQCREVMTKLAISESDLIPTGYLSISPR